jgi:hypothetical protein
MSSCTAQVAFLTRQIAQREMGQRIVMIQAKSTFECECGLREFSALLQDRCKEIAPARIQLVDGACSFTPFLRIGETALIRIGPCKQTKGIGIVRLLCQRLLDNLARLGIAALLVQSRSFGVTQRGSSVLF